MRSSMSPIILGRQSRGSIASCAAVHCDMNSRDSETSSSVEDTPFSRRSQSPVYALALRNRGLLLLKGCLCRIGRLEVRIDPLRRLSAPETPACRNCPTARRYVRYRTNIFQVVGND